jgi:hypothetical protein
MVADLFIALNLFFFTTPDIMGCGCSERPPEEDSENINAQKLTTLNTTISKPRLSDFKAATEE